MSESTMDKAVKIQSGAAGESSAIKAIKVKTEIVDAAIVYVLPIMNSYLCALY